MFTLKFTTGIRPTERNMSIARAAQIYYHKGAYAEKPVEQAEQKPEVKPVEQKKPEVKPVEQQKPVAETKADQKKQEDQKKPVAETKAEQHKPVEQKADQKKPETKAEQHKPEDKKPVAEKKPEQQKPETKAEQHKPEDKKSAEKPEQQKPETKAEQHKPEDKKPVAEKKPEQKPVVEPVVEVLDREGNIVAMLPGAPEEAPKAARTTGFDINNFVKPKQSKQQAPENFGQTKSVNEVYAFIRSKGVGYPFDPMPGFSVTEKVEVLKKYANFNGTHPGLDVIQLNTLIMIFNSPDLSRKMINCGLDPKQTLGIKRFNEVPVNKYDNNNAYDFAFEYTLSKKKKLVLLVNSIPTYDAKNGWMSGYNISVR